LLSTHQASRSATACVELCGAVHGCMQRLGEHGHPQQHILHTMIELLRRAPLEEAALLLWDVEVCDALYRHCFETFYTDSWIALCTQT
jgi:hypothetical protein